MSFLVGSQALHEYGMESSAGFVSKNPVRWSKYTAVYKVQAFLFNKHGFKLNTAAFERIGCFCVKRNLFV